MGGHTANQHHERPVRSGSEFHLLDLLHQQDGQGEALELEAQLQNLEGALNEWLRDKIIEIESGNSNQD